MIKFQKFNKYRKLFKKKYKNKLNKRKIYIKKMNLKGKN